MMPEECRRVPVKVLEEGRLKELQVERVAIAYGLAGLLGIPPEFHLTWKSSFDEYRITNIYSIGCCGYQLQHSVESWSGWSHMGAL